MDWSCLPSDILQIIFEYTVQQSGNHVVGVDRNALSSAPTTGHYQVPSAVPIHEVCRRIVTLKSVCTAWRDVMVDSPPCICVEMSIEDAMHIHENAHVGVMRRILMPHPMTALVIRSCHRDTTGHTDGDSKVYNGDGGDNDVNRGDIASPTSHRTRLCSTNTRGAKEFSMETIAKWYANSFDEHHIEERRCIEERFKHGLQTLIANGQDLLYLYIEAPDAWRTFAVFDVNWISMCTQLQVLALKHFKSYVLYKGLSPSLRSLSLEFGEIWVREILSSHSISTVDLPDNLRLQHLHIAKHGTVGLACEQVMAQCEEVLVDAMYVLLGVSVDDEEVIDGYRRPYEEGAYVPPHILGDWNAIETSHRAADTACTSLLEQMARAPCLKRLQFHGSCAESLKIIPCRRGEELDMLHWISEITEQSSSLLFGMSGEELMDRILSLKSMGTFPHTYALCVVQGDEHGTVSPSPYGGSSSSCSSTLSISVRS